MEGNRDSGPPRFDAEAAVALLKNLGLAEVACCKQDQPPLLLAARWNRPDDIIQQLNNEEGIKFNVRDCCGLTALHMAASYGNPDCVRVLLEHNLCDIDDQDEFNGLTPLMMAVQGLQCERPGCKACIKILCDKANAMLTSWSGETALHFALQGEPDPDIVELLMKKMK